MLWHSNCNFTKRAEWPLPCTCPLKEINKNGTKIALSYLMSILTLRRLQEGKSWPKPSQLAAILRSSHTRMITNLILNSERISLAPISILKDEFYLNGKLWSIKIHLQQVLDYRDLDYRDPCNTLCCNSNYFFKNYLWKKLWRPQTSGWISGHSHDVICHMRSPFKYPLNINLLFIGQHFHF